MIKNYNCLSRGRDAWLRKDVGEANGSSPTSSGITLKWFLAFFMVLLSFVSQSIYAQISYSQDWTATGLNSWTTGSSVFSRSTTQICGTAGGSLRGERYFGNSGQVTSPSLGTSNGGLITVTYLYKVVDYSAATAATTAANVGTITLEYSSSTSGPWTVAQTINSANHTPANTCATKTATFTPGIGALYIRFNVTSGTNADAYYYFDNVVVSQGAGPTCLPPTALNATPSLATLTTGLSWTASTTTPVNYEYALTTSATPPTSGTVTTATSVSNVPFTHSVTNYLHVRSFCGGSDYSSWNTYSFLSGYCKPAPTSVDGTGITKVVYGSVSNTTGSEAGNFGDYSNLFSSHGQGTNVAVNITYTTGYTYGTKIWVDWNNDYDFDDAGENVYTGESLAANPTTLAASFTIPAATPLGSYRMRIGGADSGTLIPCYTGTFASYEDYGLTVTAPPTCLEVPTLASSAVTGTTASITWTAPTAAPAGGYDYELRTSGAVGSGAAGLIFSGNETALTHAFTGLTGLTAYTAYVRSHCGTGDTSTWKSVGFTTTATCFPVPTLTSANVGSSSATINWTAPTSVPAGGYDYELRTSGAAGSGTTGLIFSGNETVLTHAFTGLTALTSYTAYVRSHCTSSDFSTWRSLSITTLHPNDICADAIAVTCGSSTAASLVGSTNESQAVCGISGLTTQNSAGIWYKILGNGNDMTVSTGSSATNVDTRLAIFSGTCGALTCITGGDDISTSNYRSEALFSTTVGTTYYVLLYAFSSFTIPTDAITLTVTCTVPCSPATTNDDCATATAVTIGTPLATNNTCSVPSSVTYPSCGSSFGTYYDTWYSFNSGSNTTLEVSAISVSPVVVGYAVYSGTCAGTLTQVGCNVTGAASNIILTTNTNYFIRAYSAATGARGNFTLNVKVPCINATAPVVSGLTATSATVTWTASTSSPSNGYQWEIRSSGAAGSGATGLIASGNATGVTATTSALSATTSYSFYVRASCSVGDFSPWSSATTFTTPCAALNVPYVQDFSSATLPGMPACTSAVNPGSGSSWVTEDEAYEGPVFPATQGKYLLYSYSEFSAANAWFFTQGVNLTANTAYAISYKYGNDGGELFAEKMKVAYGASPSVAGMTIPLADHSNIVAGNLNNQVIFTPTVSGIYYFGFNAYSNADKDILQLDDIKVDIAPTCIKPSEVAYASTVNGGTFSWTPPTTAPGIGYEWAVTSTDVPPASGATVTSATAIATGLNADTFYYFHVRSKCSATETSDWLTYSFITGYCMSTTTVPQNYYISSFSTTGAALNVTNVSTYNARGYSNFSSQVIGNNEAAVTTFSLVPTNAVTGTINSYGVSVFIDWNNDLDFDDVNERVYSAPFSTSANPRVGTITIPAGTALGNYRMRVRADFINSTTNVNACGGVQIGETEDYTFRVMPVPPAITSITPSTICSNDLATTVVTLTGSNFTGVTEVKLNDVVTSFTVVSPTSITVNLTASSTAGFFNLYKIGDGSSAVSAAPLEVNASPVVAPITGASTVCLPSTNTITLETETPTGVWTSSNLDVATVSSGGVVTPHTAGSVVISYTVTDGGCSTKLDHPIAVNAPIEISASTATQTVVTNGNTSFSVTATGTEAPLTSGLTYQWQSTVDGENFVTLSNDAIYGGTNTNTLTLTNVPAELNLTLYNVIISGACTSVTSDLAVLFVGDTGIDVQPSPASVCDFGSASASFTVDASADVTAYEWQEDRGGDNWTTLSNTGIYSGTNTPTLTLTGVTNVNSGWRYKVLVTGIGSAESNPVLLTVSEGAVLTGSPSNQTVCYTGGNTSFTVTATNADSYQWQYSSDNGSSWTNVSNGVPAGVSYSGTLAATLNVTTTPAFAAGTHSYRATVNSPSPCLPVYSQSANLNINSIAINTQPTAASVSAGNTASFTVAATTTGTTSYQWQFSTTAGGTYQNVANGTPANITYAGANTAILSVITGLQTEAGSTGRFYRVLVTSGGDGCSLASNGVLLTTTTYCAPSFASGPGTVDGISNVTVGTLNNSSTHNNVAPYYTFFTGVNVPDLMVSSSVNVSVTYGTDTDQYGGVWIDFNRNGVFDASEGVVSTTSAGASGTAIFTFNVPAGAVLGNTRMRVRGGNDSALTTAQACGTGGGGFGEAEDYIVNIIPVPPCATPVAGTITAGVLSICGTGSTTLTATGYSTGQTGLTFQWYNSQGAIPTATGFTYTTPVLTAPESYFFRATCANGGVAADSNTLNINIASPAITGSTPNTRCGAGTVALGATGAAGSTLNWYASAAGGVAIGTGATFNTPSISDTTTYYVASEYAGPTSGTVGTGAALTASFGAPTAFNNYNAAYHAQYVVTAAELTAAGLKAGNISSVAFNVTTLGSAATNANFKVAIAPTTLSTLTTTYVTTGLTTVYGPATYTHAVGVNTVNFTTPYSWDGTSNIIVDISHAGANSSANAITYYTATTGNTVVWSTSLTATTGTVSTNRLNMTFGGYFPCASARTAVTATVTAAPALTVGTTPAICTGASTSVVNVTSPVSNFDTYTWSPAGSVSGTAATGFTFNPLATTTYTLTATSAAGCTNTATLVVTVNTLPTAVTITPSATVKCAEETVTLTALGGTSSRTFTSGAGTSTTDPSTTTSTLGPNPLQNYYGGTKQQWVYRAAELTALGFVSGSKINSIALNLASTNGTVLSGLTVKMKNSTKQSFASTTAWETGMTEVISQASHTPVVGLNNFALPTGFIWDGTSSLVIEMNYSNNNGGSGSTNTAKYSATAYASTIFYRIDTVTPATVNSYTGTATGTYSSRNDVVFAVENPETVTWTPTTGLYTNAGATTPYTGGSARVVYAKPSEAATYTAVASANGCPGTAGSATITIKAPSVGGTLAGSGSVCSGTNSTVLTLSDYTGVITKWQSSTSSTFASAVTDIANTTASLTASNLTQTTYYRAVVSNQSCATANSNVATVTVNQFYDFYADLDGDGYGAGPAVSLCSVNATTAPAGHSVNNTDCDDQHATVHPGAAEIPFDGLDNDCNTIIDDTSRITTKLTTNSCGATLAAIGSLIQIQPLAGQPITGYIVRVKNGAQVQTVTKTTPYFTLRDFPQYEYATTYTIDIQLIRNGVALGYYGETCLVSTPAILADGGATTVNPSQCETVIPTVKTLIYTTSLASVTGYRFRISEMNAQGVATYSEVLDRPYQWFSLNMMTHYHYNAEYRIEVAVKTTGDYSAYGSPCTIYSPRIAMTNCDITIPLASTQVKCTAASGATQYRFQLTRVSDLASVEIDRGYNYFTFGLVPNYTRGAVYLVRVAVMTTGTWSAFSDGCEITAPGGTTKAEVTETVLNFNAVAHPNPFASDFGINVTTSNTDNLQVRVYDMLGKLIEAREVKVSELEGLKVGDRYAAGVYNVIVSQGVNVKTLRVIKR